MWDRLKQKFPEWLFIAICGTGTALAIHFDLADWVDQAFMESPGKWLLIFVGCGGILGYLAYEKIIGAITNLERRLTALMKREK